MEYKSLQRSGNCRVQPRLIGFGMIAANTICMGCKTEMRRGRTVWFFRIAILAAILLRQPSTFAQMPEIAVTNGTASLFWPQTAYYYLLQGTTNLSGSNSWFNVATASPVSASAAAAPIIANVVGNSFVITQSEANTPQFFRLKAPVVIPSFSFAIFYEGLLEFTSSSDLQFDGFVHANGPINIGTSASLVFVGTVTTTSTITGPTRDGITPSPWNENTTFNGKPPFVTNTPAFLLPFGTNNPHVMIDMPPANESPLSSLGQCRLYNVAPVLIIVTNLPAVGTNYPIAQVTMTFQTSFNGMIPGADPYKNIYSYIYTNSVFTNYSANIYMNEPHGLETFLSLTHTFTDKREYKTNMFVTQIDANNYGNWLATNPIAVAKFGMLPPPSFTWQTGATLEPTSFPWYASSMALNCPSMTELVFPWSPPIRYTSWAITMLQPTASILPIFRIPPPTLARACRPACFATPSPSFQRHGLTTRAATPLALPASATRSMPPLLPAMSPPQAPTPPISAVACIILCACKRIGPPHFWYSILPSFVFLAVKWPPTSFGIPWDGVLPP